MKLNNETVTVELKNGTVVNGTITGHSPLPLSHALLTLTNRGRHFYEHSSKSSQAHHSQPHSLLTRLALHQR